MGYAKYKDQSGVKPGYYKYRFDITVNNDRKRKTVTCRKSAVGVIYRNWEDKILRFDKPQYMLFEIIDKYLTDIRHFKSFEYCKSEDRTLRRVKEFLRKDIPIDEFRRKHIAEFITWRRSKVFAKHDNSRCKGKVSNGTINRDIAVISSFFNWCIEREFYSTVNPASRSKLKENNIREVRLNREQIEQLMSVAYDIDKMMGHVVSIALMTGMRKKEILSLEWSEVHFDSSYIMLSASKTKSRKARLIPLIGDLLDILFEIKKGERGEYVFEGYTSDVLRKQWAKLLKRIDFDKIKDGTSLHFHDTRHVYAQSLLDMGVGLEDIQSLLGHEDIKTTQKRYAMFARPDLREKAERISNIIRFKSAV